MRRMFPSMNVSILQGAVGLNLLAEAVAIGKGKRDLTGFILEPAKTNQVISTRSEIPVGKVCSSLASVDIIKVLTGDFRLSKAHSNDLFWEAVWPRLLARGWHSEQPNSHRNVSSKHYLVFLIPGIKKFSKGKLVKGNHYFDSISDVLNRVALEPKLLDLEVDAAYGCGDKDACTGGLDVESDERGLPDHQQVLYLCLRIPNCVSELAQFTIVDTSLVHGNLSKLWEMRSVPTDSAHSSDPVSSSELDSDNSEGQVNRQGTTVDSLLSNQQESCSMITDDAKMDNSIDEMPTPGVLLTVSSYLRNFSKRCVPMFQIIMTERASSAN